jgi:hypothetical protein
LPPCDTERGPIFKNWFDSYKAAAGEPFAYLQADINWERKWQGSLQPVAALTHASGVAFGIIYNGNTTTADDRQWITQALDRSQQVEAIMHADQIVFESWMIYPGHVLPESDPDSFTGMMRNYLEHHNSKIGH